ncbi:MAG: hypothetical protein ACJAV4_000745 [Pontimonas sp.]
MSDELSITTPGTLWVSEDYVLSLASHLEGYAVQLRNLRESVAHITVSERDPFTQALSSAPAGSLAPVVAALDVLVGDAQWLRDEIKQYAHHTADQERARVQAWEVPRDRLLALIAVTMRGSDPARPFSSWGMAEAGQAALGDTSADVIDVREVAHEHTEPVERAVSLEARVSRIPEGDTPIRIETFLGESGADETDVYLAGTQTWSMGTSKDPFDMESNIALIAGISAASLVAVEAAMRKAGVAPGDRVSFVGHSQGGLIAARLAESGLYATTSLLTVGAPLGTAPLRGSYPALAISHTDDVVPGLGGAAKPSGITRVETVSGAAPLDIADAHARDRYGETAERIDASPVRNSLPQWKSSGVATARFFSATRTST